MTPNRDHIPSVVWLFVMAFSSQKLCSERDTPTQHFQLLETSQRHRIALTLMLIRSHRSTLNLSSCLVMSELAEVVRNLVPDLRRSL